MNAVQVAEGLVLDLINGVQGSVRDIHAEAVQGALGVQFPVSYTHLDVYKRQE